MKVLPSLAAVTPSELLAMVEPEMTVSEKLAWVPAESFHTKIEAVETAEYGPFRCAQSEEFIYTAGLVQGNVGVGVGAVILTLPFRPTFRNQAVIQGKIGTVGAAVATLVLTPEGTLIAEQELLKNGLEAGVSISLRFPRFH